MSQHGIPFWIDTGRSKQSQKVRTKGIGQIYDVFLNYSCTIVLGMGLMYKPSRR